MKTIESREELQSYLNSDNVTVILFSADWCPDCVFIKPFLPEIEEQFSDFTFVYVNRDEHIELCQEMDIFGIPSFVAFKSGKEVGRYVNKERKTKEQITSFLEGLSIPAE
ncbi:thioredoxin family protein [Fictibacillus sp. Mic-4]|uniref:thioredoxin family protein n=1 Tax=Fictibacillus TaxID=1329200 RepID=UPI000416643C|nr:thioredoxin family protein [Fictibacillus gelatini]